jgi:hypothetical protein
VRRPPVQENDPTQYKPHGDGQKDIIGDSSYGNFEAIEIVDKDFVAFIATVMARNASLQSPPMAPPIGQPRHPSYGEGAAVLPEVCADEPEQQSTQQEKTKYVA